jgi:hypothetical protein
MKKEDINVFDAATPFTNNSGSVAVILGASTTGNPATNANYWTLKNRDGFVIDAARVSLIVVSDTPSAWTIIDAVDPPSSLAGNTITPGAIQAQRPIYLLMKKILLLQGWTFDWSTGVTKRCYGVYCDKETAVHLL